MNCCEMLCNSFHWSSVKSESYNKLIAPPLRLDTGYGHSLKETACRAPITMATGDSLSRLWKVYTITDVLYWHFHVCFVGKRIFFSFKKVSKPFHLWITDQSCSIVLVCKWFKTKQFINNEKEFYDPIITQTATLSSSQWSFIKGKNWKFSARNLRFI